MANAVVLKKAKYEMDEVGLTVTDKLHFEEWETLGMYLGAVGRGIQWALGDWFNYGEGREDWGQKYTQAIDCTGLEYQTLANYRWVAARFHRDRRRAALSFTHHQVVAGLEVPDQERMLDRAEAEGITANDLRKLVTAEFGPRPGGRGRPEQARSSSGGDRNPVSPQTSALDSIKAAYLSLTAQDRAAFADWLSVEAAAA